MKLNIFIQKGLLVLIFYFCFFSPFPLCFPSFFSNITTYGNWNTNDVDVADAFIIFIKEEPKDDHHKDLGIGVAVHEASVVTLHYAGQPPIIYSSQTTPFNI